MRILVTGDTGFIGSHIFNYLNNTGHEVRGCSRSKTGGRSKFLFVDQTSSLQHEYDNCHYILDLKDGTAIQRMMSDFSPECIIHCAANPLPKPDINDPTGMGIYDDNVKSTHLLCYHAPKGCQFIFTSSIVVYGNTPDSTIYESYPTAPTSMYGVSKVAAENIILFYKDKLKPYILRLGATVGARLTHGIIYDFIRKLNSQDKFLEVLGDKPGSNKPFLHIKDVLQAIDFCIDGILYGDVFNLTNNDSATVEDIAEIVKNITGINKPIKWLGSGANWKGDNKILRASSQEISLYGWSASMSSREAIARAVKENT